jgi:hypothetical protein
MPSAFQTDEFSSASQSSAKPLRVETVEVQVQPRQRHALADDRNRRSANNGTTGTSSTRRAWMRA